MFSEGFLLSVLLVLRARPYAISFLFLLVFVGRDWALQACERFCMSGSGPRRTGGRGESPAVLDANDITRLVGSWEA